MKDLSILIPARSEMFLARTIQDIIENSEETTEIIAVLDGAWADPPISQHPRVNVIYLPESVGQRKATNLACKLAQGKYVAKVDAHCSFDQGFDRKMVEFFKEVGDDVTAVPVMRNLWAFDWKCYHCGWKKYQGPTPEKCGQCGKSDKIKRKMIWIGKGRPQSTSYAFDSEPHFQYFEDWKHRSQYIKDKAEKGYTETMSLQGSFFMAAREKYWEWELCDDKLGNWGNQGLEVACATWLSGGRVYVNHTKMIKINLKQQKIIGIFLERGVISSSDAHGAILKTGEYMSLVTIKRTLSEMVSRKLLEMEGSGRATKYKISALGRIFAEVDAQKYSSVEPDKRPGLNSYNFDLLPSLPVEIFSGDELKVLNDATGEYERRTRDLPLAIQKKELERMVIELSWKSSKIEGNTYTLFDTEKLILKNKEAPGQI